MRRRRGAKIPELAERASHRLPHVWHRVLDLANQWDHGAPVAEPGEGPRDLHPHSRARVIELSQERGHGGLALLIPQRLGRERSNPGVRVAQSTRKGCDGAAVREGPRDLARGDAEARVVLAEPGQHERRRLRDRRAYSSLPPPARRTDSSESARARSSSGLGPCGARRECRGFLRRRPAHGRVG